VKTLQLDTGLFRTHADNGLTVLSEALPGVRSAAVGIWIRAASAHELRSKMGVSHLLEHMVFKGTERRSARQIALELEVRGGSLDAYTGRDHTSYQAHVLDNDLPVAVEILTDLVRRPLLRESDLVPERNVVLEEINGVLDTPDDLVFELLAETLWPAHPYGFSILGTADTVTALTAEDLKARHEWGYYPANVVVVAAGRVEHAELMELLERQGWFEANEESAPRASAPAAPAVHGAARQEPKDTTQAHIVFATETFPYADPRRHAMSILTNTFGGGMSSRLFQRIREELGLAYNIYAFQQFYEASGTCGVYIGTKPGTGDEAIRAIRREYDRLAREGLGPEETLDGKRQLKGQVILALETPHSRMGRLASIELNGDKYRSVDEVLRTIDAVEEEDLADLAAEFWVPDRQTMVWLGPELPSPSAQ
jgi:predicted Zn-dependent peptidase